MLASSLLYTLSAVTFFGVFLSIKKDDTEHSAVAWIVIHAAMMMWINNFIAAIYGLVNLPCTPLSTAIAYLVLTASGIYLTRKRGYQQLKWHSLDLIAILCMFAAAAAVGVRFHTPQLSINDVTKDSCMHFLYAVRFARTGIAKGEMFFAPVNIGLLIAVLKPILPLYRAYKAFFGMEIMMLALSGCVFYAVICDTLKGPLSRLCGLFLSLMYMMGYPLHNHLMGFNYLGMSVTIVALLIYFLSLYIGGIMHNEWGIWILMLGCFALVMCYMLFAPVIYIALFIGLAINSFKKQPFYRFVVTALKVFLIPCILGFYYCYVCFFRGRGINVWDTINLSGGTRGRFYSYLLLFLPGTVYFLFTEIRKCRHPALAITTMCLGLFAAVCLLLVFADRISIYYYSKIPYMLWLVMALSSYFGMRYMLEHDSITFTGYVTILGGLMLVWITNANGYLASKAIQKGYGLFVEYYRTITYSIYQDNLDLIHEFGPYSTGMLDLFAWSGENISDKSTPLLAEPTDYQDVFWFEGLTGENLEDYYPWKTSLSECIDRIVQQKKLPYVVVLYNTEAWDKYLDLWNTFDKVYDNPAGCVLRIH